MVGEGKSYGFLKNCVDLYDCISSASESGILSESDT